MFYQSNLLVLFMVRKDSTTKKVWLNVSVNLIIKNVFQDCLEKTCLEKKLTNKPTGKLDQ